MSADRRPLRVLVADDHPIFLSGVGALLSAAADVVVVARASNGPDALRLAIDLSPDVGVIDVSMPEMNGISVVTQAKGMACSTRMLVLSMHEERIYVEQALAAGARGYLLKRSTGDNLLHAVRAVGAGGLYLDPCVASRHLGLPEPIRHRGGARQPEAQATLSDREEEVVRLVAHGFTSKEVAGKLGITSKSVETHKARAAEKLGIVGRAKLVQYALTRGWLARTAD